ncbi:hypothetical protein [Flavobacterium lindanitolerans]|jgi:hypothetical protein|uniref:hypothetical protein n=1 Tax=Flavobacterium lindanitolerans TaxID=428988 RepID=UPI0023F438B8|nr:hypothetical protein [Flavobacterium lindanitolerans]
MDKNSERKINQAINLIEELSWLLNSKTVKLKEIPELLRNSLLHENNTTVPKKYNSINPNKNFLIGILPNLFQDPDLFKTNSDLIEFASFVLNISISRAEKRSRYELIGLIVCEVRNLNDYNLNVLVEALATLTNNEDKLKKLKENRKSANFSWNAAIIELNKDI